jgi:hypothetical protein
MIRYPVPTPLGALGNLSIGTTVVQSGTSGRVLYDNAGVLGEMTTSGTGTQLALTNAPTLTGTATVQAMQWLSNPSISVNWLGSVPSLAQLYQTPNAASSTLPEFGNYTSMAVASGYANRSTAYKIGSGWLILDVSGSAGNSADLYGINPVVQGYAGTGGNLLTAAEFNINNNGAAAATLGANTAAYGAVAAAGGSAIATAAFFASGTNNGFQYGFAINNVIGGTGFYDTSNSPTVLGGTGTHTNGVDFTGMTLTNAFKSTGFTVSGSGSLTMSGTLQLGSTYVGGAPAATGYITMKDSTGTTYKFLVST